MSGIPATKPLMEGYEADVSADNPYSPAADPIRWRAWNEGQQMAVEHSTFAAEHFAPTTIQWSAVNDPQCWGEPIAVKPDPDFLSITALIARGS